MSIQNPPIPAVIFPQRSLASFQAQVIIEEVATDELEITQHPVQQGAAISDHAYLKPATVTIKMLFSDDAAPLDETYQQLRDLQASREPFDVVTGKRQYTNMLFKSLGQTNDVLTERVLSIHAQLVEVLVVSVSTAAVPARYKQKAPGKTGATEKAGDKRAQPAQKSKSALYALLGKK